MPNPVFPTCIGLRRSPFVSSSKVPTRPTTQPISSCTIPSSGVSRARIRRREICACNRPLQLYARTAQWAICRARRFFALPPSSVSDIPPCHQRRTCRLLPSSPYSSSLLCLRAEKPSLLGVCYTPSASSPGAAWRAKHSITRRELLRLALARKPYDELTNLYSPPVR